MAIESDSTDRRPKINKKTIHHQSPTIPAEEREEASPPLPNLPHEIIVDILTRLPVKSLLKFRSVCKSWLSLISDPQFIQTHLNIASKNDDCHTHHHRIIFTSWNPNYHLKSCSLYSVSYARSADAVELDLPLKRPYRCVWIMGSCNGLVCISVDGHAMFLWNPSIRKSKRLPNSGFGLLPGRFMAYGFGHDKSNNDYKLVVMKLCYLDIGPYQIEVEVYSLSTDSWKRIVSFPFGTPFNNLARFVNGSLHWYSGHTDPKYSFNIVSLDLAKEEYGEVVQPNYGDGKFSKTLWVLNGCLCVLSNLFKTRADVWVMKEYGKPESWIKLFSIPYLTDPGNYGYSAPLCISKTGAIVLKLGQRLVLYNPKDGTFRNLVINNLQSWIDVNIYVESLVYPTMTAWFGNNTIT